MSIQCQICKQELGVLNSNHLRLHNMTLKEYKEKFGEPNNRNAPDVSAVVKKATNKKVTQSYHTIRTLDDLWEKDSTYLVPDKFIRIMESNKDRLDELIALAYKYKEIAVDTETTGLEISDRVTDIIITIAGDEPTYGYNYHIPTGHVDRQDNLIPGQLTMDYVSSRLKDLLEDPLIRKDVFNGYFDAIMLYYTCGINLQGISDPDWRPDNLKTPETWRGGWDASPGAHVLNENEESKKMKDLYRKYLHDDEPDPQIKALGVETFEDQFNKIGFFRVPLNTATCYAAKDGYITRRMKEFQKPYIDSVGRLKDIFYNIEMPLIPVNIDMKKRGIEVDLVYSKKLENELTEERNELECRIFNLLGDINLNSPKQLSKALFEDQKLPNVRNGSTDAKVLEILAEMGHEVPNLILDFRKKEKLISTYLEPMPSRVFEKTNKVHCNFNQNGTVTGRYSSSNPNLQNIPARDAGAKKIRQVFLASSGNVLIGCDYSQIEPRLSAYVSQDPTMISAYERDEDVYSSMAAPLFTSIAINKSIALQKEINSARYGQTPTLERQIAGFSPIQKHLYDDGFLYFDTEWKWKPLSGLDCVDGTFYRKQMKTLWLGISYNMTEKGLARKLGITEDEAYDIIESFYNKFSKLRRKMSELKAFCLDTGYVETLNGRKRRLPDIYSDVWWQREKVKKQLFNSVIQGTAADILKRAMLLVAYDPRIKSQGAYLVLTIHDEIIVESPKNVAIDITRYMIEDMLGAWEPYISLPMKVDAEIYIDGRWGGKSISVVKTENGYETYFDKKDIVEKDVYIEIDKYTEGAYGG